jgi:hypothetical protein
METWDMTYPKAAAAGLYFARSRIEPAEEVIVHSPPPYLTVYVYAENGARRAYGVDLQSTEDTPMARLLIRGDKIERTDIWPDLNDIDKVVILPGGEAGILKEWWNAEDYSQWRWRVEFFNQQ